MKTWTIIIPLFFSLLSLSNNAGEMTGAGKIANQILLKNGLSIQALNNAGHEVLLGEFTGAGKGIDTYKVQYFITKDDLYKKNEVRHYQFAAKAQTTKFSELEYLEINEGQRINKNKVLGLVY
jgi:hypothetical protein